MLLLQRLLLSDVVNDMQGDLWVLCIESLVLPLQSELLELAATRASVKAYADLDVTLKGSLTLMSRVFLARVQPLATMGEESFAKLWFDVIDAMEAFTTRKLHVGDDFQGDMVPHVLKNMLLVMHSEGVLTPVSSEDGSSLWERTMARVAKVAPALRVELQG